MKFAFARKLLLFTGIFFILQFLIGKLLKTDYNSLGRIMVHEMHSDENIDILLLGDSHLRKAINVPYLEKISGNKVFSASSSNQEIDTSYALLQECYTFHPELKEVYVTLDYFYTYIGDFKDRSQMNNIYNISDYLKNKKVKFNYLTNACSPKYYLQHILQFSNDRISIQPKKVLMQIKSLLNGTYWKYPYPESDDEIYIGKGCCISYNELNSPIILEADIVDFDNETISDDYINTIKNILSFCNIHNLKCTFLTIPVEPFSIYSINNYDAFSTCLKSKINNDLFYYYDFNLTNDNYLKLSLSDFYDNEHQNYNGSLKTTDFFNTFINTQPNERQKFFYESLETMSCNSSNNFYGIYYDLSENKDSLIIYPVYNYYKKSNISYDFYLDDNNTITPLKLNSEDNIFQLPYSKAAELKVFINMNNNKELEFNFPFNTLWMEK